MEVLNRNVANMSDLEIKGYVFNFLQKAESRTKLIRYFEAVEYIEFEEDVETSPYNFTPEQVAQIMLADAECDDPNNLVSHEEAVNQIESWLNR
jgi:ABC-type microcin C transport system duplicated ATPase subunit YejF